ncbi:MAG: RNA polymerase sigma factor [Oscillospiraceae bacterium]
MTSYEQNNAAQAPLENYIASMANGDRSALAALYNETKTAVYGFALSILKNTGDAEDVLHDAYVKLYQAAPRYRADGKPMAWILTVTKNLALSLLRSSAHSADVPEDEWQLFYAESPSVTTEDRIVLDAALLRLGQEERRIVMLHAVSGLKHCEIAELLSLPLSTVLSKYSRAIKKLQELLKEGE